jgi:23S rRNA pseudouridine2605 synthase
MPEERLQKILAHAGIASRRKAEELIVAGHVSVNGQTVTELGSKADLATDQVKVDGHVLSAPKHFSYYAFNKPKNVVTTVFDPEGRETVMKFFKGMRERIYPVGRLDYLSEGLLLLTNDGDFANALTSPASHVTKTYLAKIKGTLTHEEEELFRAGIPMHGRKTAPAGLKLIRKGDNPWYEVRLIEGRQNQIRIMFKHFNHLVEKLKRVQIGFLDLGDMKPGAYRTLTNHEVARFRKLMKLDEERPEKPAEKSAAKTGEKIKGWLPKKRSPRSLKKPRPLQSSASPATRPAPVSESPAGSKGKAFKSFPSTRPKPKFTAKKRTPR